MKKTKSTFSAKETNANTSQLEARKQLEEIFINSPLEIDELMTQMGLFIRSSYLVKFLVLDDLYKRIVNVPGDILEFGTRFGHNLVVFENLRSIHEPFNKTRKIVGFDTFDGYNCFSSKDKNSEVFNKDKYKTFKSYPEYLKNLLCIHEKNNILGHISGGHDVVKGDVSKTATDYFDSNPETIVALSYFDMGLYEPTKAALKEIKPNLVPGSVILLDELTWKESPGEAIAFKEVFKDCNYKIEKSKFTPMRSIITIK